MSAVSPATPSVKAPLLHGASAHAVEQLRAAAARAARGAQWLFRAADPADHLYVVLSGRLQAVAEDGRVLREVGAGAALGELGLLTGSARSAGVRAVRDSRLLEIDAEQFTRLVEQDGRFALSVARELRASSSRAAASSCPSRGRRSSRSSGAGAGDAGAVVQELARALGG